VPCSMAPRCPLFGKFSVESALLVWKDLYCDSARGHLRCERFRIAGAGGSPEPDLLPNGRRITAPPAGGAR